MKIQTLAIASLCACTFVAAVPVGAAMPVSLFVVATTTTTTTTTVTTTTADGTTTKKETTVTTTSDEINTPAPAPAAADAETETVVEVSPEAGGYTYVEYDGVWVPYYKGYYFINGVWVWRGSGKPPFPPPRFRPRLRAKPPVPVKPVTKAPVKKAAPVKRAPAKASRRSAPKPPRP